MVARSFMKINSLPASRGKLRRMSSAWSDSGTLSSLPAFILLAGIVQALASKSISLHGAVVTWSVLAPVKIANSSARAAMPSR